MQPLGSGIFSWCATERRFGRYGSFFLARSDSNETVRRDVHLDLPALRALEGMHVRISLRVAESRPSGHGGDQFLQLFPGVPPAVGSTIELAVGRLILLDHSGFPPDDHPTRVGIGIAPSDGRRHLWLDPEKLYRLHDQTVDLCVKPTCDPESDPSPLVDRVLEDGVMVNADGESLQIRGAGFGGRPFIILPEVEPTPDGVRIRDASSAPGKRLAVIPASSPSSGLN